MHRIIGFSAALLLAGCLTYTPPVDDVATAPDSSQALLLMAVEEGYVFNAGKAMVRFKTADGSGFLLESLATASGDAGDADRTRKGGALYFRAVAVDPGAYMPTDWFFRYRRGESVDPPAFSLPAFEAGEIYYLGRFFANNLTQTARISDEWTSDQSDFEVKFPFLRGAIVRNVADTLAVDCWRMDVTAELVADYEALQDATANCF